MSLAGPISGFFRTHGPLGVREFPALIDQLRRGRSLAPLEAHRAIRALVSEGISEELKAEFLRTLHLKGETSEEVAAFALTLRQLATSARIGPEDVGGLLMDVCGSGGDQLHTFNISTTVAFILAAAGVPVAKHGNRAITSRCGSADVLEALGVRIDLPVEVTSRCLKQVGIAFFFAPLYHRAFKHIAPVRQQLAQEGHSTVFNVLGPLLCPAAPNAQLVGIPNPTLASCLAEALQLMGVKRALVVTGRTETGRPMDEISTLGTTSAFEFTESGKISSVEIDSTLYGLPRARLTDLAGGTREENARTIAHILDGSQQGPQRDIVLLNAAAALRVAGRVRDFDQGIAVVRELIDSGRAAAKLRQLIAFTNS